ncbi:hypothetical protein HETIRDRAFT_411748 [Heterobasidion irregulare TC 32-1]|uniref:Tautomerase cis-CaaD-like domain-containing protein n=1 Tax=Heterobasidion irregulare (strain TC 32-1) TaxID=747525 RepID=W4JVR2_HETIT|nr:uncharacterized protein HETIRDRAFT_411748 [Heterobasidion irregulare TC 32-1]ETW77632.1 hypothetical protein HETIRDRAFT_411748 [Heterobasidion irregulare TC 32-1]
MPLYVLYYHAGSLSFEQKQTIAKEVTDAHCAVTGAGPYFVKVAFQACERGDFYTAGDIDQKHVRFVGYVRRGRNPARMQELLQRLYRSVRVGQPDETVDIEMHVQEADADVWTLNGVNLPQPGSDEEQRWNTACGVPKQ